MKTRNLSVVLALFFMIAGVAFEQRARAEGEIPARPAIGSTIGDFTLPDSDNKEHSLKSLAGKNGTVLLFVSVQCPVSNAYNERMEKLAQDYKAKGINVIGINSNVAEDAAAVKPHAADNKLSFTILKDPGNKIADKLGATVTPEAYFLDGDNRLLYHGRIDNARNAAEVQSQEPAQCNGCSAGRKDCGEGGSQGIWLQHQTSISNAFFESDSSNRVVHYLVESRGTGPETEGPGRETPDRSCRSHRYRGAQNSNYARTAASAPRKFLGHLLRSMSG